MALIFDENTIEYKIQKALFAVIDPELGVNIVDLGLIYKVEEQVEEQNITVDMTLSSPGCPLGDVIMTDVRATLKRNFPGHTVIVNLVWEPTWTPDMVTEAGKEELNM